MAKCAPKGKDAAAGKKGKAAPVPKKPKRKGHPANMFILYFLYTWRKEGGNMFCMAKVCAARWKTLPQAEKDKFKKQYCAKCKACESCKDKPKKSDGGGKGKGGKKC